MRLPLTRRATNRIWELRPSQSITHTRRSRSVRSIRRDRKARSPAAFVNFGWALTPQPAMIPIDESIAMEGVRVRQGLDVDRQPGLIAQDADGGYSVGVGEVGPSEPD